MLSARPLSLLKRSADRFCQRRGWTRAAWSLMETEGRSVFLADVLCTRQP